MKRLLAFDIETAKILPESAGDLLAHRPLGITCAAATARDLPEPIVWHGHEESGGPSPRMGREEAVRLVADIERLRAQGYKLVTWNGAGFDFLILAEESGLWERCARLAADHIDMFFHALCSLGHFVSLQRAAEGMGLEGKPEGMSGVMAPALWAAGRHEEVLRYCRQDVRTTLGLAIACEEQGRLRWVTRSGGRGLLALPSGWLTVQEAGRLPLPDTSWMSSPPSRESLTGWFPKGVSA
jgi:hypothetical protein